MGQQSNMAATTAGISADYTMQVDGRWCSFLVRSNWSLISIYILFLSYGCAHMGLNVISLYLHSTKVQEKNTVDLFSFIEHT